MLLKLKWLELFFTRMLKGVMTVFFSVAALLYLFQVGLRLLFSTSLLWIDPLVQYCFILAALFGAALACRTDENIKIELLRQKINAPSLARLRYLFSALATFFILVIFIFHFREEYQRTLQAEEGALSLLLGAFWLDVPYLFLFLASLLYYGVRFFEVKQKR